LTARPEDARHVIRRRAGARAAYAPVQGSREGKRGEKRNQQPSFRVSLDLVAAAPRRRPGCHTRVEVPPCSSRSAGSRRSPSTVHDSSVGGQVSSAAVTLLGYFPGKRCARQEGDLGRELPCRRVFRAPRRLGGPLSTTRPAPLSTMPPLTTIRDRRDTRDDVGANRRGPVCWRNRSSARTSVSQNGARRQAITSSGAARATLDPPTSVCQYRWSVVQIDRVARR